MHPAQFTKFDIPAWNIERLAREVRPTRLREQTFTAHAATARKMVEVVKLVDARETRRRRCTVDGERRDGSGALRAGKRFGSGFDHIDGLTAKAVQKKITNKLAVIHVQPFRRRDERSVVSRLGPTRNRKKEIDVKPCKRTRFEVQFRSLFLQPLLPFGV